jgi:O-antigen/teichoic acid export membrane protein
MPKLAKDSFLVALIQRYSSTLVVQLSAFVVGMTVSKLLGPELLGYWGIFLIITSYYSYSNLGATNGLTRSLGIALGKNDQEKVKTTIGAAHAVQLTLPVLTTAVMVVTGFAFDSPYNWIIVFAGIFGFISLYEETLKRILSSFERHKMLAMISVARSLASIVIVIPLVYFFSLQGRIGAALILAIVLFGLNYKFLPVKLDICFDKSTIKEHIAVGFPIAMAGFLFANFFLVDRLIITSFLSVEQLGFYVFGFYLVTVIKGIKQTVSNILYQRQNIVFGEDGPLKKDRLLAISKSAAYFTTDLTGVLSGVLLIVFAFAVKYLMPEYEAAIPLTFVVVFSQVMGSINVFNTVGKHKLYLLLIAVALVVNIGLSVAFVHFWGLLGVAYATFISFLFFNIIVNFYNLKFFGKSISQIINIIVRIVSVPIYCYVAAWAVKYFLYGHFSGDVFSDLFLLFLLLVGYTILMLPLLFFIKAHVAVLNQIKLLSQKEIGL